MGVAKKILHTGPSRVDVALIVNGQKCPACGSPLVRRSCPCPFRRKGWATCAQCINKRCKKTVWLAMRKR